MSIHKHLELVNSMFAANSITESLQDTIDGTPLTKGYGLILHLEEGEFYVNYADDIEVFTDEKQMIRRIIRDFVDFATMGGEEQMEFDVLQLQDDLLQHREIKGKHASLWESFKEFRCFVFNF